MNTKDIDAKDMERNMIFVFFFNFFQYVWPELMKVHIKIWNSELREMYANVFFLSRNVCKCFFYVFHLPAIKSTKY